MVSKHQLDQTSTKYERCVSFGHRPFVTLLLWYRRRLRLYRLTLGYIRKKYSSRRTTAMPNLRILQHGKSTLYSLSQTHFKLTSQVHQGKRNIYQGVRGSQNLQATFWVSLSVYRSTWTYSSDLHYCCYAWLWTSNTCQSFEKELKTLWVFLSRRHI